MELKSLELLGSLKVSDRSLRSSYMWEANERQEAVSWRLDAEHGSSILMIDRTYDASAKCSLQHLFNVMSCGQKCLPS